MISNITNNYNICHKRPKLCCEEKIIYNPVEGGWTFSHHPYITFFKGKFYVMWSNGRINEDDVGQRILYSFSEDFEEWAEPRPLIDSQMGESYECVISPCGFYFNENDGKLVAYYFQYEYMDWMIENGHRRKENSGHKNMKFMCITTTDGLSWSEPIFISSNIVPNHPPARLKSGRLLISGSVLYPYTDNPDGIHDWKISGIYPKDMDLSNFCDDSEGIGIAAGKAGWPVTLCEGSFIQTDDGVIHMMLRSGTDWLWVTESYDNGESWTEPRKTRFTDNRTKFHFGRLPNGTFYYVGTPDPFPPRTRHVLVLSLSEDGLNYNRHFILQDKQYKLEFPGLHKNGIYGYPSTMVHDGYLYVTVSICKERIMVMRVPCDTL